MSSGELRLEEFKNLLYELGIFETVWSVLEENGFDEW
jgi:hypothetical protein